MKRCPKCRRDYTDDSLLYCLEDGNALVQGSVPSTDEPATAVLSEPPAVAGGSTWSFEGDAEPATAILSEPPASAGGQLAGESATRPQIHTTEQTAIFPRGAEAEPQESFSGGLERHSLSSNRAAKPQEENFGGRAERWKVGGRQRLLAGGVIVVLGLTPQALC